MPVKSVDNETAVAAEGLTSSKKGKGGITGKAPWEGPHANEADTTGNGLVEGRGKVEHPVQGSDPGGVSDTKGLVEVTTAGASVIGKTPAMRR